MAHPVIMMKPQRMKLRRLQKEDAAQLEDAFYQDLEFGTGGLGA